MSARTGYQETTPAEVVLRRRTEVLFLSFILVLGILAARLIYLQGMRSGDFLDLARRNQEREIILPARRGAIRDRLGAEMAVDVPLKSAAIDPTQVQHPSVTAARVGEILGLSQADTDAIRERIERLKGATVTRKVRGREEEVPVRYCLLRRDIERVPAEALLVESRKDPQLRGIWLDDTPRRYYPGGRDASQILGTVMASGTGAERRGADGLEYHFNKRLAGKPGKLKSRVNALEEPIPETAREEETPVNGEDIQLTLDRDIQHFVEEELARTAVERKPDSISAIVMEVSTGNLLALANWPTFDPEDRPSTGPDPAKNPCRNRAVTDLFEPGSIFKVFTAAAALETGIPTHAFCRNTWAVSKRIIHCAHNARHGQVDLRRMVEQSCNIAAGTYAQRIGRERLYTILDHFGFQAPTGIPFPGESYAKMLPPDKWLPIRTINVGFGQGIAVTPLQIAAGYNAIANEGVYLSPKLVLEPKDAGPSVTRSVMTREHAALLLDMMTDVVMKGTGKAAKIRGYSVAGKTGTAQMSDGRRYIDGYVASFAGIVPAGKPRLTILVSVTHPRVGEYGGVVAAPAFREIARRSVDFLKIRPDMPGDIRDGTDPGSFLRAARAEKAAAGD